MKTNEEAPMKGWLSEKMEDPEFRRHFEREGAAEEYLTQVEQLMERMMISRSKLAAMMGCKPSNITKVMRRSNNLKLSTMVDIANALKQRLRVVLEDAEGGVLIARTPSWRPVLIPGDGREAAAGGALKVVPDEATTASTQPDCLAA